MTTIAIVQARMRSTRLPGKVLELLDQDTTVLSEVLERCGKIAGVDIVCCATPAGVEDDPVAEHAQQLGCTVFRGSEADVLDRYFGAARSLGANVVLRVTSDCPLIDPEVCSRVIGLVVEDGFDYAANNMPPSWPHGLDCEAITMAWLERAWEESAATADREHVTPFLRRHPGVKRANLLCPQPGLSCRRWTLDTAEDLLHLRRVFAALPDSGDRTSYHTTLTCDADVPESAGERPGSFLPVQTEQPVAQYRHTPAGGFPSTTIAG